MTDIDPTTRTLTVGQRILTGDHLVVSLGADWATDRMPGLGDHGHTYATLSGAQRLARELAPIESGRVVVVTAAPLYKCPANPYEAAPLRGQFSRAVDSAGSVHRLRPVTVLARRRHSGH